MTEAHKYFTAEATSWTQLPSFNDDRLAICVCDAPRQREDGSEILSLRWPMMILTELCSDRAGVAKMVAEVLNENAARFFPTAPGRKVEAASPEDLLAASDAEIARLRGEVKKRNSVIAKVYGRITNIADDLDDQGDRVFLGSTNDADMLRSLRDEWTESRVMKADIATPEEEVANLRARLRREVAAAEAAALDRAEEIVKVAALLDGDVTLRLPGCSEVTTLNEIAAMIHAIPRDGAALDAVVAERTAKAMVAWKEDPAASEAWSAGCDFAMTALCKLLQVDPHAVSWDAATEELEGDVMSVLGNIVDARFGEDWPDLHAALAKIESQV